MNRLDNQLLINKTKMNMNSGNLQVKRSPESIPRKFGNFLAGLSGKALILGALMVAWTIGGANVLQAQQCGFAVPSDPANTTVTYTVSLDTVPSNSCVVFNQQSVQTEIAPTGSGCQLYYSLVENPSVGDTLYSEINICCNGTGDVMDGQSFWVFSDTSNNYSDEGSSVGVEVIVNVIDNTDPNIDAVDNRAPEDGASFTIYTGLRYRVDMNTDVVEVLGPS